MVAITELHPIAEYAEMSWQALLQEMNHVNSLQHTLEDYPTRKALLGLYLMNIQDASDIAAYRQRIAARQARIAQLTSTD